MSESTGRALLLATFFLALAVVSWDEIKHGGVLPRPRRYVGAGVVFAIAGLAAPVIGASTAGVFGAGMVLALLYQGVLGVGPGAPAATGSTAAAGGIAGGAVQ